METKYSITKQPSYEVQLIDFQEGFLNFLSQHNLPTTSIFTPIPDRVTVFKNTDDVLSKLDNEHIERSVYISKFFAAVAVGLFDAALNYLWDETISELRRRVAQYDISYFFDSAVENPSKRKKLKDETDLVSLNDSELISGASAIELISDIGYRHLDNIRYMRNWASAAHPNQNELTGLQLISWLETCIREVISLPLSNVAIEIKRLLANVKNNTISDHQAKQISSFFIDLTEEQADNLASGFFGIYTRSKTISQTRQNIHRLLPLLWDRVSENTRQRFGLRYAKFSANNSQQEQELSRSFLQIVSAEEYIPDNLRAVDIQTAIEDLLTAHRGINNFHNEPPFARQLQRLIGRDGNVPTSVNKEYVFAVIECFLTNGHGVSWEAEPIYIEMLNNFDAQQASRAVLSFAAQTISSRLQFERSQDKYYELLKMMKVKISSPAVKELIDEIEKYKGPLYNLGKDPRLNSKIRNLLKIVA